MSILRRALFLVLLILLASPVWAAEVDQSVDFPQREYFQVTHVDQRLCPSPFCGGVFVKWVNRYKTKCADGSRAKECHAAIVDWSALGLTPAKEARVNADFVAKRILARGELELVDLGFGSQIPTLVVSDAWRGVTGTVESKGRFFGVIPSGIVCITFPCPTLIQLRLNQRGIRYLHSLDLGETSGATNEQIGQGFDALYQGDGLLVFATMRRISGPAGYGRELVASEFYTKVDGSGGGQACGGFTFPPNPSCDKGEFCEQPPGTCLIADLPGTCQPIPEACIAIAVYDPVCGCDGVTYSNDCERQRAQVALDHPGACSIIAPEPCGFTSCAPGTVCCNPLQGICTPPGWACIQ